MELIDTHCHLDRYYNEGRLEEVVQEANKAGVSRLIAVGTTMNDWQLYERLATVYPKTIYYTVGLHPCYVKEDYEDHLVQLMPYFAQKTPPLALGEIGLDFFHLPEEKLEREKIIQLQYKAFQKQLAFGLQLDCPIVIHSRKAFYECVEMIEKSGVDWGKIVFHCFPEGKNEVKILNAKGARASFTGLITFKNAPLPKEALIAQGIDKLMIETDAPYLAPTPYRGQENRPAYLKNIAIESAALLNLEVNSFCKKVKENTEKFFNFY